MPITKADLAALPNWARVALAARAARRAQQLLASRCPDASPTQVRLIDEAIRLSEAIAAKAPKWATDGEAVAPFAHDVAPAVEEPIDLRSADGAQGREPPAFREGTIHQFSNGRSADRKPATSA
jgi:hypothetical protein